MKVNFLYKFYFLMIIFAPNLGCTQEKYNNNENLKVQFENPSNEFRPQPLWWLNNEITKEGIYQKIKDADEIDGFGGVAPLPIKKAQAWGSNKIIPGVSPEYLSDSYFERYGDILKATTKRNMEVILYDDNDFPTGTAGGQFEKLYPEHTSKRIEKEEWDIIVNNDSKSIDLNLIQNNEFIGVVAFETTTKMRTDLVEYIDNNRLKWMAPSGKWKIMSFSIKYGTSDHVDYMDGDAVKKLLPLTYGKYAEHFEEYFGTTIQKGFFDDIGYWQDSQAWNGKITKLFKERTGKNPLLYYPALWYDIGKETYAARSTFFGLRAELMGEGYPKEVAEWCKLHGIKSMGHPPGNYEPNTTDMHGDPFKFYKHTQIPLMDAIHGYPNGRPGFKLISSAADVGNKPIVAVEIYGAYPAEIDSFMLYRAAMEEMTRGINFFIPHGEWYDSAYVKIAPLISHNNKNFGALKKYSDYIGRSSVLLSGGNRIADIGLLYPIEDLEAWYYIKERKSFGAEERPTDREMPIFVSPGKDIPEWNNYNVIGDWLTRQFHKDFTFIYPEYIKNEKYSVKEGVLSLVADETNQNYKLLILPATKVFSVESLKKINDFYESGGKVLAVGKLPEFSSEFGRDKELNLMIQSIFGINPKDQSISKKTIKVNTNNGKSIFLPETNKELLSTTINDLLSSPDIEFNPAITSPDVEANQPPIGATSVNGNNIPLGEFSYIHKQKDGTDIYLFANSMDKKVDTWVTIRGKHKLEKWNPYTGETETWKQTETVINEVGEEFTRIHLVLNKVSSVFAVSVN